METIGRYHHIGLLYCPFPTQESAQACVRHLLEKKQIVCAQIIPAQSMYLDHGAIVEASEWTVIMKTSLAHLTFVREHITALHPYRTPAILSTPVVVNDNYYQWVMAVLFTK